MERMTNRVILRADEGRHWLDFQDLVAVVQATTVEAVRAQLEVVCQAVQENGLYAAGYLAYEAAPAMDPALVVRPPAAWPLLWFGLYRQPAVLEELPVPPISDPVPLGWQPTLDIWEHGRAVDQIKAAIARGDTYQVNFTFPLIAPFDQDPWTLFSQLAQAQQAPYAAYVDTGRHVLCSASPELFFRLDGERLVSRPMKGTAPRGRTLEEDRHYQSWLQHSEKNRAENVMIVDMIRNDMGRIAEFGSVQVPNLFVTERYPTVWQMTSTVACRTRVPVAEIMAALFPCASITGAPKVRTMQIIAELEQGPRGVYTGCIGYLAPDRQAQFNVAIRTVAVDRLRSTASYGVGGGIVWDSDATEEYQECQVKARVLSEPSPAFELLETMLWTPEEGYFLLGNHLRRLADSAAYFGVIIDPMLVRSRLESFGSTLGGGSRRVRLLVAQDGTIRLEAVPLVERKMDRPQQVGLATFPVDSGDRFLYHKTTQRQVYEAARRDHPEWDDVLLWNVRGELTESTVANLVVRVAGELVTPPASCGLLAGTFRRLLLEQGTIREQIVRVEDLVACKEIYLINSVRRWQRVQVVDGSTGIANSRDRQANGAGHSGDKNALPHLYGTVPD